jgi:hypothetical protein
MASVHNVSYPWWRGESDKIGNTKGNVLEFEFRAYQVDLTEYADSHKPWLFSEV